MESMFGKTGEKFVTTVATCTAMYAIAGLTAVMCGQIAAICVVTNGTCAVIVRI